MALSNAPEFSVSEISSALKKVVETNFAYVRVRGEISGFRGPHSSGHCYFSLKDDKAKIDAIVWRGVYGKMRYKPEEGMEVIAIGKLSTFAGKSGYQILIESIEPSGEGALMALLEKRKKMLATEGLFEESRKLPLPYLPQTIGVITSPTGAVIRDILHRLGERMPSNVLLWPVRVQGEGAAEEVAAAVRGFAQLSPDLIIVARGGGSVEDLWAFNEEIVARAVAECAIPIISAVGHETDTTLIDFVSDRRAPTPTAAAEIAVPVRADLLYHLRDSQQRMQASLTQTLHNYRQHVQGLARGLPKPTEILASASQSLDRVSDALRHSLQMMVHAKQSQFNKIAVNLRPNLLKQPIDKQQQQLNHLQEKLNQRVQTILERRNNQLQQLSGKLALLDYNHTLKRGFALVKDDKGVIISKVAKAGKAATLVFYDGEAVLGDTSQISAKAALRKSKSTAKASNQESLF